MQKTLRSGFCGECFWHGRVRVLFVSEVVFFFGFWLDGWFWRPQKTLAVFFAGCKNHGSPLEALHRAVTCQGKLPETKSCP